MRIRQAQSYTSINLRKTEKNSTENVHTTHLLIFISILSQTKCQTLFIIRCRFIFCFIYLWYFYWCFRSPCACQLPQTKPKTCHRQIKINWFRLWCKHWNTPTYTERSLVAKFNLNLTSARAEACTTFVLLSEHWTIK